MDCLSLCLSCELVRSIHVTYCILSYAFSDAIFSDEVPAVSYELVTELLTKKNLGEDVDQ